MFNTLNISVFNVLLSCVLMAKLKFVNLFGWQNMKLAEAILMFGNKARVARACQVTRSSVTQWGDEIPKDRALTLRRVYRKLIQSRTRESI